MRLIELGKQRPKKAGRATLEYEDCRSPFRRRTHIVIPDKGEVELLQLQENWNQFLAIVGNHIYFGGTDENPFLVEMDSRCLDYLWRGNPEGFYQAIIPQTIAELVKRFGGEYKRQGDIFAWPVPFTWEEIMKATEIVQGEFANLTESQKTQVFGTRHILVGFGLASSTLLLGKRYQVVEGVLTAPDHSPKELKGPHILAQTELLHSPKEAD